MSIPCDCTQCGGSDQFAMCENYLIGYQKYRRSGYQWSGGDFPGVMFLGIIAGVMAVVGFALF